MGGQETLSVPSGGGRGLCDGPQRRTLAHRSRCDLVEPFKPLKKAVARLRAATGLRCARGAKLFFTALFVFYIAFYILILL